MTDELGKYYELFGVAPGVSGRELKQAYHDLAKVWHPDRFSHDPRLQQKAQEKLKEINEAYELLTSGRGARPTRTASPPSSPDAPPATAARRKRHPLVLPTAAVVFCIVFFAALSTLLPAGAGRRRHRTPDAAQAEAPPPNEERRPDGEARATPSAPTQPARGKERAGRQPTSEATSDAPAAGTDATQLRPMATVTVKIDAVTGQLATRDCPTVSRMTYPAGSEPRQHCTTPHKTKVAAQADSKDSRLKAVAKRLAEPFK